MSFATIGRLERLHDHREAELFYNHVTPIRGRAETIKPLGARRDADKYQIVKGQSGYYAARLYNTDVVTFEPSGEIVIATGGYNTALTMQFISEVLGIRASRQRGSCVFNIGQDKYITKGQETLRIRHIGNGQYEILSENKHFQYVVNRTAANNVRKRSAEFRKYLKGFVSLRTQEVTKWSITHEYVCVPVSEMAAMFGCVEENYIGRRTSHVKFDEWMYLTDKRHNPKHFYKASQELDRLITSENSEDYYRAALILVGRGSGGNMIKAPTGADDDRMVTAHTNLADILDESQFKLYAKEVFTLTEVKQGRVPNTTYDSWVDESPNFNPYDRTQT